MGYPNSLYVSQHDMDDPSKDSSGKRSPPGSTKTTPVKQLAPPKRSRHSNKEDEATLACINMCHSMIIDRCMHILSLQSVFAYFWLCIIMHQFLNILMHELGVYSKMIANGSQMGKLGQKCLASTIVSTSQACMYLDINMICPIWHFD